MKAPSFNRLTLLTLLATVQAGAGQITVTTAADELDPIGTPGSGVSLREALRDVPDGDGISFDPAIFNGEPADTITLTLGRLEVAGKQVTIDAGGIPGGVTVSGNDAFQVFRVFSDATVTMNNLTITAGRAALGAGILTSGTTSLNRCRIAGNIATAQGGGFQNQSDGPPARLTLNDCTIAGNSANFGGGGVNIAEAAGDSVTLVLTRSAVSGNHATTDGGGLENYASAGESTLTLEQSTIAGNSATSVGGGLINFSNGGTAKTHLRQCTVSGNSAILGRGIRNNGIATAFTLFNSIVAGNPLPGQQDFFGLATSEGGNLIGNGTNLVMAPASGDQVGTGAAPLDPLLGPLAHYGGPTPTMALLPGSPARDAGESVSGYGYSSDQRGFPRSIGQTDIGAYEAGTPLAYNAWAYETLPASASPAAHAAGFDVEQDGRNNALEYASLSDPLAADAGCPLGFTPNAACTEATIVIPIRYGACDLLYIVERSFALNSPWTAIGQFKTATGAFQKFDPDLAVTFGSASATITDPGLSGHAQVFYRLRVIVGAP